MPLKQHMFIRNDNVISPRVNYTHRCRPFWEKEYIKLGNNVIVPSKQHSQCESLGCTMNLFHFDAV